MGANECPGTPGSIKDVTHLRPTHSQMFGQSLILSVDDEPVNHLVIEAALSTGGYEVRPLSTSALEVRTLSTGEAPNWED